MKSHAWRAATLSQWTTLRIIICYDSWAAWTNASQTLIAIVVRRNTIPNISVQRLARSLLFGRKSLSKSCLSICIMSLLRLLLALWDSKLIFLFHLCHVGSSKESFSSCKKLMRFLRRASTSFIALPSHFIEHVVTLHPVHIKPCLDFSLSCLSLSR